MPKPLKGDPPKHIHQPIQTGTREVPFGRRMYCPVCKERWWE